MTDERLEAVPIEEDASLHRVDCISRYYVSHYAPDVHAPRNDHHLLVHTNKLFVLGLAAAHPLVVDNVHVTRVRFAVSADCVSGKRKLNAQRVTPDTVICQVECSNDKTFNIHANVHGKVIELNEKLLKEPEWIKHCCLDDYRKRSYIAVIMPHLPMITESMNGLLTEEQYRKVLADRT